MEDREVLTVTISGPPGNSDIAVCYRIHAGLNFQKMSNASTAGVYHEAETRCQSVGRSDYVIESNRVRAEPWSAGRRA